MSAEFADALARVLTRESVAEFGASFDWAPLGGQVPEGLDATSIPAPAAPRVARVAEQLRQRPPKVETEALVGVITAAKRDPERGGVVTLDTVRESRSAHVNVRMSTDERFDEAVGWLQHRTTVVAEGRVHPEGGGLFRSSDRLDGVEPLSRKHLPEA